MSRINKSIDASFEIFLRDDGIDICFDDQTDYALTWKQIIDNEQKFFCVSEKNPYKFSKSSFDDLDKVAEGLIDAGAEIKKILAEGSIVD